jgi:glyoxylase-like metal-dependent hydrolase (beta-lactamase superfamily II)
MITNVARGARGFTSNAFLVTGERTVLVDAGANFEVEGRIRDHVDALDGVVLTHTHPDHVGNLDDVRAAFDVEVEGFDAENPAVDAGLEDGDAVVLGDHEYRVLHTPGHAPDHVCLYGPGPRILFAGDLIFQNGAFGRTDLEGGDRATLIESIDRVRSAIDEDLAEMHTGHGPSVTTRPYDDVEAAGRAARMG